MRRIALLALAPLLLLAAACGDDSDGDASGSGVVAEGGSTEDFCEQAEGLGDFGETIDPTDPGALEEGVDRLEQLAGDAPDEIAGELETLVSAVSGFTSNLASADPTDPEAQLDAVSSLFAEASGEELDDALSAVQDFGQRECGIEPETTDPSFAELQEQIEASGGALGTGPDAGETPGDDASGDTPSDGGGDPSGDIPEDLPDPGPTPDTDDPELTALIEGCEAGDMQACDDLFFDSEIGSDAEAYGDTCGARVEDAQGELCTVLFP